MTRLAVVALAVALGLGALPAGSVAQTADAAYAEARARFVEAVAAVEAGRPADAVGLFERSYALRAAPVVAINLAVCLRGLGRFAAAREWYALFLATASPDDLARHEVTARAQLEEVSRRLARVSAGPASPAGATVLLDGAALLSEPRWIEAGDHRVDATAPGHVAGRVTVAVRVGEVLRLETQLAPVATPPPITQRWWFWTAVGVAVAGVTAAALVPALQPPISLPGPRL